MDVWCRRAQHMLLRREWMHAPIRTWMDAMRTIGFKRRWTDYRLGKRFCIGWDEKSTDCIVKKLLRWTECGRVCVSTLCPDWNKWTESGRAKKCSLSVHSIHQGNNPNKKFFLDHLVQKMTSGTGHSCRLPNFFFFFFSLFVKFWLFRLTSGY